MGARDRYASAAAFRAALEHRLRREAQRSGVTLQRLRKEAAYHRLLYRLQRAAPDSWAIKGGFALILRLGEQARATRDVDANWLATATSLEDALSIVEEMDDSDWFTFDIGDARPLQGEGEDGAFRYAVTATLDGRVFEQLILDVNVVGEHDPRPIEVVTVSRNPFDFVDEPPLQVPMITPDHQLAEKLHAYTRRYSGEPSSRARDLFDMLVIAEQISLPDGATVTAAARETFRLRSTPWPPRLHKPPDDWAQPWKTYTDSHALRWASLDDAHTAVMLFWDPVLDSTADSASVRWDPTLWRWTPDT
ncbi:MAG: nucleotidyl transferase AbiEii/AbiGii toxin family protein [Actinobacteria bacterium]|nr:nucleotidyl transferase AbiEii/AbiGii toxin family protein [Actinomycetota bacterium]